MARFEDSSVNVKPWIFVSYRRGDRSGWAARQIATELEEFCGENSVFCDTRSIHVGEQWDRKIRKNLQSCRAFIALIDSSWFSPRLKDPEDWVRREIETAIKRRVFLVPVLLDGAQMPKRTQLPKEVASLTNVQALSIDGRSDSILKASIGVLAKYILDAIQTQMVLARERSSWWRNIEVNSWVLYFDDEPLIFLQDTEISATAAVATGPHRLWIEWLEQERDSYHGRAYAPGHRSAGKTGENQIALRPGKYVLTLATEPDTRSFFRRIPDLLLSRDNTPRYIDVKSYKAI